MRENTRRAFLIGGGIAGAMFAVAAFVCLVLYTPCSNFCERAPGSCKTEAQISAWKGNCEHACRTLEKTSGLQLTREVKEEGQKEGKITKFDVGGTEYVQTLNACAFSGG